MALRSIEHYRSAQIRRFLDDLSTIDRIDLLLIKGVAFLQDLLTGVAATRLGVPEDDVRRRFRSFSKLVRKALNRPEEQALRDLILEFARIRNRPAHELEVDEYVAEFRRLWERLRGDFEWPSDSLTQRDYCESLFALICFEIGHCHVGVPPSPYVTGEQKIDWQRLRDDHEERRWARKMPGVLSPKEWLRRRGDKAWSG